jgi:hypothetical protein
VTEEAAEPASLPSAAGEHASGAVSAEEVTHWVRLARARADDAETDSGLRKWLGFGALGLMAAQLVIADTAFFLYGFENAWDIPVAAINVWLGSTVVQVVVVVHTVARYLFPANGRDESSDSRHPLGG